MELHCSGQKKHFGVRRVFRPGLHNREAAEGLPQLFCDRFIELHLLLQVEADDAVVIVDPVTVEVIHLSLQSIRHGADSLHHRLLVLGGDFTGCNQLITFLHFFYCSLVSPDDVWEAAEKAFVLMVALHQEV